MAGAQDQNDLRLRQEIKAPLTTVGAEMTYKQLDDNFIALFNLWNELIGGINVAEYDAGVVYTDGNNVKYDNHYWVYVSGIDQSGVTPGTDETVWLRATIGTLIGDLPKRVYVTDFIIKMDGNTAGTPESGDVKLSVANNRVFSIDQHDGADFNNNLQKLSYE